jgi:hypothetical protein
VPPVYTSKWAALFATRLLARLWRCLAATTSLLSKCRSAAIQCLPPPVSSRERREARGAKDRRGRSRDKAEWARAQAGCTV